MRLLRAGMDTVSSQATTEVFLNAVHDVLPAFAHSLIQSLNATMGLTLTAEDVPAEFYEWEDTKYREMLRNVLGDIAPTHDTVYFCPSPTCDGSRRSDNHSEPCTTCQRASYTYVDKHGQDAVCTLHYYPMATLIRLMFADPIKAQHVRGTYEEYEAHTNEMTGVFGESFNLVMYSFTFIYSPSFGLVHCCCGTL